jgi:plastocyanin
MRQGYNVVSATKELSSPVLDTNDKYSFTFPKAGGYSYFCSLHPHMTGRVVVS